ncbi:hypothetical protein J2Y86_001816 [Pseudomonas migulae]|uniref:hypothetical protein n=1 Tax=Pseudomonas migulae TaxID=78543 RepID=UPI0020A209D5|nr:hypothetical protein [Pseudomonas migulae]MCP1497109.1 hypothetical protein [Pseudomonas migulae]
MSDQYNQMHEKLVKTSEDFTGMIAYSIYKAEKREAIKNGLNIVEFTKLKLQSNEIGKYKREADGLVNLFLQAAADEKIKGIKAELARKINKLTLDSLPKDRCTKVFLGGITLVQQVLLEIFGLLLLLRFCLGFCRFIVMEYCQRKRHNICKGSIC